MDYYWQAVIANAIMQTDAHTPNIGETTFVQCVETPCVFVFVGLFTNVRRAPSWESTWKGYIYMLICNIYERIRRSACSMSHVCRSWYSITAGCRLLRGRIIEHSAQTSRGSPTPSDLELIFLYTFIIRNYIDILRWQFNDVPLRFLEFAKSRMLLLVEYAQQKEYFNFFRPLCSTITLDRIDILAWILFLM